MRVDKIRQQPVIDHREETGFVKTGTSIRLHWPFSACSNLQPAKSRFLQICSDFAVLNPHLTLRVKWLDETWMQAASNPNWRKWRPSEPTSAHWYSRERFERLIAGYIADDRDRGEDRLVREFVAEFRGLSSTAKQKAILDRLGLGRMPLSALAKDGRLDTTAVAQLLIAMQQASKPVPPKTLGVIGGQHLEQCLVNLGGDKGTFQYQCETGTTDQLPWVLEAAFAWRPGSGTRRLITGANWSPAIINPFRDLSNGLSLDSVLEPQHAGADEPVIVVVHLARPGLEFTDRGKSALVIRDKEAAQC